MITVQELAVECGCAAEEVLTQLSVMNVFTLGPDSFVRDDDAEAVRRVLLKQSPTPSDDQAPTAETQLSTLRDKLTASLTSNQSRYTPTDSFAEALRRITAKQPGQKKSTGKHWYPDNDAFNPVDQALAERMVPWGERSRRRTPGMIYFHELQAIKRVHKLWVQACMESGYLMSDDQIIAWLKTFPHRDLDPYEVIAVAREGVTPTDAALHLWYGRLNPLRPTVFDRICWKDITVEDAKAEIERHKHAG